MQKVIRKARSLGFVVKAAAVAAPLVVMTHSANAAWVLTDALAAIDDGADAAQTIGVALLAFGALVGIGFFLAKKVRS